FVVIRAHVDPPLANRVTQVISPSAKKTGIYSVPTNRRDSGLPAVTIWIGARLHYQVNGLTVRDALNDLVRSSPNNSGFSRENIFTKKGTLQPHIAISVQPYTGAKAKKATLQTKLRKGS